MDLRRVTRSLHTSDILIIGFANLLSILNVSFSSRIPYWGRMVVINCCATVAICLLGYFRHASNSRLLRLVHDWYVPPIVFFSFKEIYFMIKPMHMGRDYDDVLIAIDHWLFGVNPTEWLMRFANPFVTEILQLAYTLFYFMFLFVGYELYRRHNPDLFHYFMFTCVYGFFLSYLGYFTLPAIGPRFTLHDFAALDRDLPGVFLTPYLRWFVNAGESLPTGVPNDLAVAVTQRDVFPSGHTMMTLVLIYISAKFRIPFRLFVYVTGVLLIFATVYERYHYVIDLLGGAAFMVFCVATSRSLYVVLKTRFQTMESRFPPG
jgi:membrane-associated phospholipid phosphatase